MVAQLFKILHYIIFLYLPFSNTAPFSPPSSRVTLYIPYTILCHNSTLTLSPGPLLNNHPLSTIQLPIPLIPYSTSSPFSCRQHDTPFPKSSPPGVRGSICLKSIHLYFSPGVVLQCEKRCTPFVASTPFHVLFHNPV